MSIFVNPGSGPVAEATESEALTNMRHFAADLMDRGASSTALASQEGRDQGDGRWQFTLDVDGVAHEIEMPGIPLHRVRFVDADDQNIWHFPRLYVDGSSWVWMFAVNACRPEEQS